MKLPNKYIAIDIETTDADYHKGDIIQIGAVVVNEDLSVGERFSILIQPTSEYRNPEAMEVNKITETELKSVLLPNQALDLFETFALKIDKRPLLAAWGTYFDVVFLKEYYRKLNRKFPFSYRCLDLKSIAIWEAAKIGTSDSGGVSGFLERTGQVFEGKPHDGLDDIVNTMKIIQFYGNK